MSTGIEWINPGHKQRRYDLFLSKDQTMFKKSTPRLHAKLQIELNCLEHVRSLKLTKIQQLVEGEINTDGISYIITKYCGRNVTRSKIPPDWREQLDVIDKELNLLIAERKVYHNDVQTRNLFVKNGLFTIIDFDLGTIGSPSRRSSKRPGFTNCDYIREKFQKWGVK